MPSNLTEMDKVPRPAELLYLLHGDPAELSDALSGLRPADIADALRHLPPDAAARLMAVLPFDLAVPAFDEPELTHHRADIITRMGEERAAPLIDAMSGGRRPDSASESSAGSPCRR